MQNRNWNIGVALFFIGASLLTLFIWIPADIETGVLVEERRSVVVGDAMAPTAAAVAVLITALGLLVGSLFDRGLLPSTEPAVGVSRSNLVCLTTMAAILIVSLQLMVWGGAFIVSVLQLAGAALPEYRLLTDTVPYKYIGFVLGGFTLVCGMISWIEGRVSLRASAIALGAVVVLIVVYDLPFDTLLLPPNGSQ
jgi:hypothetical protein